MTACLTDIFCSREQISWLLVFLFFQITFCSKTVKTNQICYSPGYLYIFTGFCTSPHHFWYMHVAFTSGTCRLPCCQMKFVFAYFVLTYNCNLWDEANIFFPTFSWPSKRSYQYISISGGTLSPYGMFEHLQAVWFP